VHLTWITLLWLLISSMLYAKDHPAVSFYQEHGLTGTMVIENLSGKKHFILNAKRANTPLLPASTFKILNTLIGLSCGVIHPNSHFIWDKKRHRFSAWNQDHNLSSAFHISCVWCYQQMAKKIGLDAYKMYLKRMEYGNQKTGSVVTSFWLEGDLRITALEQVEFLKRLYHETLPFSKSHQQYLKSMMHSETSTGYTLYAKTGWATRTKVPHGWFVGFIETSNDVWLFAHNMTMPSLKLAPYRKTLLLKALKHHDIL